MSNEDIGVTFGTPTMEEVKRYFARQLYIAETGDISPGSDSSSGLDDSFKQLLEKRHQELEMSKSQNSLQSSQNSSAACSRNYQSIGNDSTFLETSSWIKTSDASFEEMERICSLNQTTFNNRTQRDEENEVLERMYKSSGEEKQKKVSIGFNDVTQLDEVEAPSCLWENTILPELSPVKRVHMLRPSTIVEEGTINETGISKEGSFDSFVTATQNGNNSVGESTTVSSDNFRTAEEDNVSKTTINSSCGSASESLPFDLFPKTRATFIQGDDYSYGAQSDYSSRYSDSTKEMTENVIEISSGSSEDETEIYEACEEEKDVESILDQQITFTKDSFCDEDLGNTSETPDCDFNDTLEEMEYMMAQGMKMMSEKKNKPLSPLVIAATPTTPNTVIKNRNINSPSCKQSLFPKSATNSSQKAHATNTSSFKKPTSRLPLIKSTFSKRQFDHIRSPIGAYINNSPHLPLSSKMRGESRDLISHLYNKNDRESVVSAKENMIENMDNYTPSIPRKGVIASSHKHVLDERKHYKIPGGDKVHQLLSGSSSPTVIRHEGRLKVNYHRLVDNTIEDSSFADLSVMSGDISVQVMKDGRKF